MRHSKGNLFPDVEIYYCSRTHTQLQQVIQQLKATKFNVKAVTLGSRKNLCLQPHIRKLSSINRINEECKDLIADKKCEYYKEHEDTFLARLSLQPTDIEDMFRLGKMNNCCPYYGSREYFLDAQVTIFCSFYSSSYYPIICYFTARLENL